MRNFNSSKLRRATLRPSFSEEISLWEKGIRHVIGVDEVGRGAFAGPVTVAGVVFSPDILQCSSEIQKTIDQINDSKLLLPKKRETLAEAIQPCVFTHAISTVSVSIINKIGIGKATEIAFRRALQTIGEKVGYDSSFVLIDGFHIKYIKGLGLKRQKAIVKGDRKSISIAAASILAKVHRDTLMRKYHQKFSVYDFATNKGYGTKKHQEAMKRYGLSKIHRTSFDFSSFLP